MWLLEQGVLGQLREANGKTVEISAAVKADFEAMFAPSSTGSSSRIMSVEGNVANIQVSGVISNTPDIMSMLFGGGNVLWSEIQAAISEAAGDSNIEKIQMQISSGGGSVDGMFDALAAVRAVDKPVVAMVNNLAASAAFGLASQADEIVVNNRAARIGSVGIVARIGLDANSISVTSTNAPNKAPDMTTEEGQDVLREELDAMHFLFVEAIAEGRSAATGKQVTIEDVNANFGKGSVFLAEKARDAGMIDGILGTSELRSRQISNKMSAKQPTNNLTTGENMDYKTLKREHAETYEAAVADGVAQERDRVVAHLLMGQAAGAVDTAIKAVEEGAEMTNILQAKYMSAGMVRKEVGARAEDDVQTAGALNNITPEAPNANMADLVATMVEQQMGVA